MIFRIVLKVVRKIYLRLKGVNDKEFRNWKMFSAKEYSNKIIYNLLISDKPCMIARFGSTEMLNVVNYLGTKAERKSVIDYIRGKQDPWWWEQKRISQLKNWSGFFPAEKKSVERFCEIMLEDAKEIDVLGSWLISENKVGEYLKGAQRLVLEDIEPFFAFEPWTKALEGKKVLVVHPFAESIISQYKKRELLFENDLLPDFDLKALKAVQSLGGSHPEFESWFEALDFMKNKISKIEFDICIIGAGAYGLPLAAHVKRMGKKAIHLAGVTQLLFGIKGKRWEKFKWWPYMNLFNESWVRPGEGEKPKNAEYIEGSCYW